MTVRRGRNQLQWNLFLFLAACTVYGISGSLVFYSTVEVGFSGLQLISSQFLVEVCPAVFFWPSEDSVHID